MIIGLTGPNASGKGEIARYLAAKGFAYHSLSDVVREEAQKRGLDCSRENLILTGNDFRMRFGASILARKIRERLTGRDMVDSIRNIHEILELKKEKGFFLLGIDAPIAMRFERSLVRGRAGDGMTLQEFQKKEEIENSEDSQAQQLSECMKCADRVIVNDGTLADLHRKIEEALAFFSFESERTENGI